MQPHQVGPQQPRGELLGLRALAAGALAKKLQRLRQVLAIGLDGIGGSISLQAQVPQVLRERLFDPRSTTDYTDNTDKKSVGSSFESVLSVSSVVLVVKFASGTTARVPRRWRGLAVGLFPKARRHRTS